PDAAVKRRPGGAQALSGVDLPDLQESEILPVTVFPAVVLSPLHLENNDLLLAAVLNDFSRHLDVIEDRFSDLYVFPVGIQQYIITLNNASYLGIEERNLDIILRFYCKLFASQVYDCVHFVPTSCDSTKS
ncbi:MAG TPA: hypothetical protein VLA34_07730, partial [Candidatus Krumholzibacterium sp.]|nr:hypothetical protein [Candidatus Krumholzibacterium sp.]